MQQRSQPKVNEAKSLQPRDVERLRRSLEAGVAEGVLVRVPPPQYALWRFEDVGRRAFLTCFGFKKGGHKLLLQGAGVAVEAALAGRWDALRMVPARAAPNAGTDGAFQGPRARLELAGHPVDEHAASRSRPAATELDALSEDQRRVFERLRSWTRAPHGELRFGGLAGTGKSTVIALLARELSRKRVAFCAPTGRAALGLAQKLAAAGALERQHFCGTIHRLIYHPEFDPETGRLVGLERRTQLDYDLLVVDEASMVGEDMYGDLRSYGRPMLFVGDHGQLEPISRPGAPPFSLMRRPELTLETVHRQLADSPILTFASHVRQGGRPLAFAGWSGAARLVRAQTPEELLTAEPGLLNSLASDSIVLTHTNRARCEWNLDVRRLHWGAGAAPLVPGERVVCLRNAYFVRGDDFVMVANGARGLVAPEPAVQAEPDHLRATVLHDEEGYRIDGELLRQQLGAERTLDSYEALAFAPRSWHDVGLLYDYGYAVTVHKAQGSQFRRVILVLEPGVRGDPRWIYTAATRAIDELIVVAPH